MSLPLLISKTDLSSERAFNSLEVGRPLRVLRLPLCDGDGIYTNRPAYSLAGPRAVASVPFLVRLLFILTLGLDINTV